MDATNTPISDLIQGGIVGIAILLIVGVFILLRRSIEVVNAFVTNHITHLSEAIDKNTEVLLKLEDTVDRLSRRF